MDYTEDIVKLFSDVMNKEITRSRVERQDFRKAVENMGNAYKNNPRWRGDKKFKKIDYDDSAHQCAYLHKYTMLHTGLTCEILQSAFYILSIKRTVSKGYIKLCSLGGGPGTDIVALLFLLNDFCGLIQCDVTIMDVSRKWQRVFDTIVSELRTGHYGMSAMVANGFFNYRYLNVDLLCDSDNQARGPISDADIITMVKFVSAAACSKTSEMIRRIFLAMKQGALVLFIDNAAGRFHEMLQEEARRCGLETVFGPLMHHSYEEIKFHRELYGISSLVKTKVAVEMWLKVSPGEHLVNQSRGMEVVEIDGPCTETIHLDSAKVEPGWLCCSVM